MLDNNVLGKGSFLFQHDYSHVHKARSLKKRLSVEDLMVSNLDGVEVFEQANGNTLESNTVRMYTINR